MHYRKSVFRSLAMVTQLGFSMMTPIFLCIFIGCQMDYRFGTKTLVPLLILGVLAGCRCVWQMVRKIMEQAQKEDQAVRQERLNGSVRTGSHKPKRPSRIQKPGQTADQEAYRETDKEADKDAMA